MRRSFIAVALVYSFLAGAEICACSCVTHGDEVAAVQSTDVVFVGRAVASEAVLVPKERDIFHPAVEEKVYRPMRIAVLRVESLYKGKVAPLATIVTGFGGGDCGFVFEVGETYIVYARTTNDAEMTAVAAADEALTTSICSFTRAIEPSDELLGRLSASHPPSEPLRFNLSKD